MQRASIVIPDRDMATIVELIKVALVEPKHIIPNGATIIVSIESILVITHGTTIIVDNEVMIITTAAIKYNDY